MKAMKAAKAAAPAPVMKKGRTMKKRKQCKAVQNRKRCQAYTASPRSEYCRACFLNQAASSGSQSGGGCSGNKGNVAAKGNLDNKGNAKGNLAQRLPPMSEDEREGPTTPPKKVKNASINN